MYFSEIPMLASNALKLYYIIIAITHVSYLLQIFLIQKTLLSFNIFKENGHK